MGTLPRVAPSAPTLGLFDGIPLGFSRPAILGLDHRFGQYSLRVVSFKPLVLRKPAAFTTQSSKYIFQDHMAYTLAQTMIKSIVPFLIESQEGFFSLDKDFYGLP